MVCHFHTFRISETVTVALLIFGIVLLRCWSAWGARCSVCSPFFHQPGTNTVDFHKGNGQKRELLVGPWPETGGQKYEGSKHSIWVHLIGQHHFPPVSVRTPTGTSRFSLIWSAPIRFWPHFVVFCCSSPVCCKYDDAWPHLPLY